MKNDKRAESEGEERAETERVGEEEDEKVKGRERKGKVTLGEEGGGGRVAGF